MFRASGLAFQQLSGERGGLVRELLGEHDVLPLHRLVRLFGEPLRDVVLRLRVHAQGAVVDSSQVARGVGQQPANALLGLRRVRRRLQRAGRFFNRRWRRGRRRRGHLAAVAGGGSGRSGRGAATRGAFGVVRGLGPSIGGTAVTIGSLSIGEDTTRGGGSGVSRGGPPGSALARAFAQPAAATSGATSAATATMRRKPVTLLL